MWMIANRLTGYDVEKKLEQDAEAIINSALPVYIPGCVRIRAVGPDVVCEHEQGWIRIRDLGISDGYMLIQSIFDWYQDRLDRIDNHIMSGDYQALAEEYHLVFGNPVMIQDSNYRLLGLSEPFSPGQLPPEWDYIRTHGQSSAEGYQFMSRALLGATVRYRQNVRRFQGIPGSCLPFDNLEDTAEFCRQAFSAKIAVEEATVAMKESICLALMVVPAVLLLVGAVVLLVGFRLPKSKLEQMQQEIEARKAQEEVQA